MSEKISNTFGKRADDKLMNRILYDAIKIIAGLGVIAGAFIAFGNSQWYPKDKAIKYERQTDKALGHIMAEQRLQKEMSSKEFEYLKESVGRIEEKLE